MRFPKSPWIFAASLKLVRVSSLKSSKFSVEASRSAQSFLKSSLRRSHVFSPALVVACRSLSWLSKRALSLPIEVSSKSIHYYISTKNPTAVLSDFWHFPVACMTLWFFLSVGGSSSVIRHLSNPSVKRPFSLPSIKCKSSVIQHLQVVASTAWPSVLHLQASLNQRSMKT